MTKPTKWHVCPAKTQISLGIQLMDEHHSWYTVSVWHKDWPHQVYRRLSLSQSPGDQTKYFEISVVWDSQPVTSFTFFMYMYVELQIACTCISQLCKNTPEGNQYVELIFIFVFMGVN